MSNFLYEIFSYSTAEEQEYRFFGECSKDNQVSFVPEIPHANYRIIDGDLCQIIGGLSKKEVRQKIEENIKTR
jgi:hypothetical protein